MLRFLSLKFGRLYRYLKFIFLVSLLVVMLMNTQSLFASFQKNELMDRRFINLNKCPACFGTSWCRKFMNGQITFETWGRLRFLDFFNVKNVYFAQYGEPREGTRRIVLKRMGSNQELADIDQKICKRATGRPRCDLIQAVYKTEFARLNGEVRLLTPEVVEGWSDLVYCPSQRLLDRIVRRYAETKDSGSFLLKNLKDTERMQLLLTLAFNPEPLVLQTVWGKKSVPFVDFLGVCSTLVFNITIICSVWEFLYKPVVTIYNLKKKILSILENYIRLDFFFFFLNTDVNFRGSVLSGRSGEIIVIGNLKTKKVDKNFVSTDRPENWDEWYESKFEDCDKEACLSFSKDILCSRTTADHNYYAICQNLLSKHATWRGTSGGLLHDPPAEIAKDGRLEALLDECANPKKHYGRFQAAKELREYLVNLSKNVRMNSDS
uniref:Divergent protein kinase domain 2A n=1 Tax=Latimeria chalumnae TaxID=7897 RepID=H3A422_LATCH